MADLLSSHDRVAARVPLVLVVGFGCLTAYWIYSQMYYFADGAYFFLHLMESGDFVHWNPSRRYADCATQFLPVAALKILGIRNYSVLSYLYGINLYFPPVAGLAICYLLVRDEARHLMVFPLLSFAGLSMNSILDIISQSHVISSIFWPILFYVILKERFSLLDSFIFFTLVLVFLKSYESALFLGPVLVAVSLKRIFRKDASQRPTWAAATLLFAASVVIAVREILHPYDAGNRTNFLSSLWELYGHYPAVLSLCTILVVSILFFRPRLPQKLFTFLAFVLAGAAVLVSFGPLVSPGLIEPRLQYSARVMTAYFLPLLGILFCLIGGGRISVHEETWKRVEALTALLLFAQISWHLIAVSQWDGFRKVFKEELSQHRGLLFFEDSILSKDIVGKQLIRPLVWPWTVTTMSILWSDKGNVSTIITNMPAYAVWGPVDDPLRVDSLPKVEQFGFSFRTYKESPHEVDRTYTLNKKLIFSSDGNYSRYIQKGWAIAEATHVWTEGKVASLIMKMPNPPHDLIIDAEVMPFVVPPRLLRQRITLSVNGEKIGELEISRPGGIQFTVPRSIWLKNKTSVLEFMLPDAASARSVGYNDDTRMIALGFRSLTIY